MAGREDHGRSGACPQRARGHEPVGIVCARRRDPSGGLLLHADGRIRRHGRRPGRVGALAPVGLGPHRWRDARLDARGRLLRAARPDVLPIARRWSLPAALHRAARRSQGVGGEGAHLRPDLTCAGRLDPRHGDDLVPARVRGRAEQLGRGCCRNGDDRGLSAPGLHAHRLRADRHRSSRLAGRPRLRTAPLRPRAHGDRGSDLRGAGGSGNVRERHPARRGVACRFGGDRACELAADGGGTRGGPP